MTSVELELPRTLGHYTLMRRLGRGGMGVVYAARDERLGREVALKMIGGLSDDKAVKRFWREARAAASVSHPNVCQIYEVDETDEGIYLAMELLEGEALDARLARRPCTPAEAIEIALDMLAALAALHERGIVHRDIKPSNIFVTPHGVKLVDFGLARPITDDTVKLEDVASDQITRPGMIVGTPRYMAPEQINGGVLDGRTDLFAVGCVLFEMLAGRPPFAGDNVFNLVHAILNENPPALQGPPAVVAVDRVIRRALAKAPAARYATAEMMAADLRAISMTDTQLHTVTKVRALVRLVVPPLRLLRDDPDAAFLSYGLAESISGSLAALGDVVVRSPALAARSPEVVNDPRRLAAEADVDLVVSGSLMRMGEQLRATIQVVEAGSATVVGGATVRGEMNDIFAFEDELTRGVVTLLSPYRMGADANVVQRDVPANGRAFEYFLRGLELGRTLSRLKDARTFFERALEEDPAFAPAWAWLGRCHRVIGKYEEDREGNSRRAEEAFRRALALSPELAVAHRFFTHFESENGRADAAIARLLQHARANRNDAQLFAALVHACRYGGLMGASLAAHEEAHRLDPSVPTSVEYTFLITGNLQRLAAMPRDASVDAATSYLLLLLGRLDEFRARFIQVALEQLPRGYRGMLEAVREVQTLPPHEILDLMEAAFGGDRFDPEAIFIFGLVAAQLGAPDRAIASLSAGVHAGYAPVQALESFAALDSLRSRTDFHTLLEQARQRRRIALAVFERGDGPSLLGIPAGRA